MKSVVVTGGTRRLGKYIADRLRADGWRVLTTSSRADSGADIVVDLAEPMGAAKLYAAALKILNGVPPDALVNNAALFVGDEDRLRYLNYESPKKLTILMAGRECGRGTVVNILDAKVLSKGFTVRPTSRAYDESKLKLYAWTLQASEMFADTLDVDFVAPGETLPPEGFHLKAETPPSLRPTPESIAAEVSKRLIRPRSSAIAQNMV